MVGEAEGNIIGCLWRAKERAKNTGNTPDDLVLQTAVAAKHRPRIIRNATWSWSGAELFDGPSTEE